MKKIIFISILIILCIGSTQFVNAQLLGKWVLPTVYGADEHETYLLSFTETGIESSTLETLAWDIPCEFAAGGYNPNYDLLFYYLGDLFCYGDNSIEWNSLANQGVIDFKPEFQVINKPGFNEKFFSFYTVIGSNKTSDNHFNYIETHFIDNEPQFSAEYNILPGMPQGVYMAFALTEEFNNERFLYASAQRSTLSSGNILKAGLKKWPVNVNGVDMENMEVSLEWDDPDYNFVEDDFSSYNLELKVDNNSNTVIAWISSKPISFEKVFMYFESNDQAQTIDLSQLQPGRIAGIEFSGLNDDIIYISCTNLGIIAYDYQNQVIIEYLTSNGEYGKTFLQTAPDGHIYAVSNDGNNLSRINMQNGLFETPVLTFNSDEEVATYRVFDNQNYYILPENERQYETLSATVDLTDVTCPGWTDGDATIYVSGGTPPYSIECTGPGGTIYFTWDVNQNAFYTNNLAEGIYTYTILDLYENPFPNPPPGTFEIKVDNSNFDFKDVPFEVIADYEFPNAEYPDDFYRFELGIHISNNAVLTINNSYFEFGWEGRIIIEPGSKLIVNNSTLTYYAICELKWQGIEVWGDITKHQFTINGTCYQGYLELKNNSVISFAEVGVALCGEQNQEWLKAGGIVQSNNTNFINNTKAVHFVPYENFHPYQIDMRMDNLSSFKLDTFDININNVGNNIFYKHADLFGVKGINFHGCTFTNSDVNYVSQWNLGIAAYGAGFDVRTACTQQITPCPPEYTVPSSFNGFYQAIGVYSSDDYIYSFMVDSALFQNNSTGVYVSGVDYEVIIDCNFEIGYNPGDLGKCGESNAYGIDLHSSIGFAVEDNYFTKLAGAPAGHYFGIRVYNCLSFSDDIYRNQFVGLSVGNQAELSNRSEWDDDHTGVAYLCNQNTANDYDFYVANDSKIRGNMGDDIIPSGNILTDHNIAEVQFQNDYTENIEYYYNVNEPNEILTEFSVYVSPYPVNAENTCPPHYGGGGGHIKLTSGERQQKEQDYTQNLSDYNGVKALFDNLKDGGNTNAELLDIQTTQPDDMWALRAQLLGDSPHLSREVLMETADKTDVFPESAIFDIMAANPDELRKDTLISYLENKSEPLPAYMIETLRQLADGSTYKTVLLNQMSTYYSGKVKAAQDIIRSILSDSITNLNDLRNWLDNIGGLVADKQIISTYIQEGDTTNALTLLNILPAFYDLQDEELDAYYDYSDMVNFQITLQSQNRNIHQLDSTEIACLLWMADSASGDARMKARNILEYAYDYHYCDCPALPDSIGLKSSSNLNYGNLIKAKGMEIVATPNPASTWVAFDYRLALPDTEGMITISDVSGRVIEAIKVTGNQGQKTWDIRRIKQGVYIYTLNAGGFSKSGKLIIK